MTYKDVFIISIEERERLERVEQAYRKCKEVLDNCGISYYRALHDNNDNKEIAKQAVLTDELLDLILS